jgi:hypothetical protein
MQARSRIGQRRREAVVLVDGACEIRRRCEVQRAPLPLNCRDITKGVARVLEEHPRNRAHLRL